MSNQGQKAPQWRVIENPDDGTSMFRARVVCGEGIETIVRAMFVDVDVANEYVSLQAALTAAEECNDCGSIAGPMFKATLHICPSCEALRDHEREQLLAQLTAANERAEAAAQMIVERDVVVRSMSAALHLIHAPETPIGGIYAVVKQAIEHQEAELALLRPKAALADEAAHYSEFSRPFSNEDEGFWTLWMERYALSTPAPATTTEGKANIAGEGEIP